MRQKRRGGVLSRKPKSDQKRKRKANREEKKTKAEESKGEVGQWKGDSTHPHGKSQKK